MPIAPVHFPAVAVAALDSPLTLFEPAFARRALLATLCVALIGGALGTTIVLRDLPFFTHAVGAGAYPMMVVGAGWGVSLVVAAQFGALAFAGCLWLITLGRGADPRIRDTRTGLLVAAALAAGAVLTTLFANTGTRIFLTPEAMLFGSVLTVDDLALAYAALMAVASAALVYALGRRWLAAGFDRGAAASLKLTAHDAALLLVVALAVAATLPLTGALMAGALLVIPAATARMFSQRAGRLTLASLAIAVAEGLIGLYLSLAFDLPAGATIAAVAGAGFVVCALGLWLHQLAARRRPAAPSLAATALAILVLLPALAGCGASGSQGATGTTGSAADVTAVVATTTQVADIVRQIGGVNVAVKAMLRPGEDPHQFEPRPSDVAALATARVIFRSGGNVDAWLKPAIDAAGGGRMPIDLSDAAVLLPAAGPRGSAKAPDLSFNPHWYLDPANLQSVGVLVRDELIKANPTARESYRANAARYAERARAADAALSRCAARLPASRRVIVTDHNDFDYLARRYGIRVGAQLHESGAVEPSVSDVQRAVAAARAAGAVAMVTSVGEGGKLASAVASRLKIPRLDLYSDSLAAGGEPATSLGAIAYDLDRIAATVSGGSVRCPLPAS